MDIIEVPVLLVVSWNGFVRALTAGEITEREIPSLLFFLSIRRHDMVLGKYNEELEDCDQKTHDRGVKIMAEVEKDGRTYWWDSNREPLWIEPLLRFLQSQGITETVLKDIPENRETDVLLYNTMRNGIPGIIKILGLEDLVKVIN